MVNNMYALRNILLLIIALALFSFINANGADIVKLEEGDKAPFTGALVSPDRLNEFRQLDETNRLLEKKILTMRDLGVVMESRVDLNKKLAEEYKIEYTKSEAKRSLTNLGHFLLGVAITTVAFKIAQEAQE